MALEIFVKIVSVLFLVEISLTMDMRIPGMPQNNYKLPPALISETAGQDQQPSALYMTKQEPQQVPQQGPAMGLPDDTGRPLSFLQVPQYIPGGQGQQVPQGPQVPDANPGRIPQPPTAMNVPSVNNQLFQQPRMPTMKLPSGTDESSILPNSGYEVPQYLPLGMNQQRQDTPQSGSGHNSQLPAMRIPYGDDALMPPAKDQFRVPKSLPGEQQTQQDVGTAPVGLPYGNDALVPPTEEQQYQELPAKLPLSASKVPDENWFDTPSDSQGSSLSGSPDFDASSEYVSSLKSDSYDYYSVLTKLRAGNGDYDQSSSIGDGSELSFAEWSFESASYESEDSWEEESYPSAGEMNWGRRLLSLVDYHSDKEVHGHKFARRIMEMLQEAGKGARVKRAVGELGGIQVSENIKDENLYESDNEGAGGFMKKVISWAAQKDKVDDDEELKASGLSVSYEYSLGSSYEYSLGSSYEDSLGPSDKDALVSSHENSLGDDDDGNDNEDNDSLLGSSYEDSLLGSSYEDSLVPSDGDSLTEDCFGDDCTSDPVESLDPSWDTSSYEDSLESSYEDSLASRKDDPEDNESENKEADGVMGKVISWVELKDKVNDGEELKPLGADPSYEYSFGASYEDSLGSSYEDSLLGSSHEDSLLDSSYEDSLFGSSYEDSLVPSDGDGLADDCDDDCTSDPVESLGPSWDTSSYEDSLESSHEDGLAGVKNDPDGDESDNKEADGVIEKVISWVELKDKVDDGEELEPSKASPSYEYSFGSSDEDSLESSYEDSLLGSSYEDSLLGSSYEDSLFGSSYEDSLVPSDGDNLADDCDEDDCTSDPVESLDPAWDGSSYEDSLESSYEDSLASGKDDPEDDENDNEEADGVMEKVISWVELKDKVIDGEELRPLRASPSYEYSFGSSYEDSLVSSYEDSLLGSSFEDSLLGPSYEDSLVPSDGDGLADDCDGDDCTSDPVESFDPSWDGSSYEYSLGSSDEYSLGSSEDSLAAETPSLYTNAKDSAMWGGQIDGFFSNRADSSSDYSQSSDLISVSHAKISSGSDSEEADNDIPASGPSSSDLGNDWVGGERVENVLPNHGSDSTYESYESDPRINGNRLAEIINSLGGSPKGGESGKEEYTLVFEKQVMTDSLTYVPPKVEHLEQGGSDFGGPFVPETSKPKTRLRPMGTAERNVNIVGGRSIIIYSIPLLLLALLASLIWTNRYFHRSPKVVAVDPESNIHDYRVIDAKAKEIESLLREEMTYRDEVN